MDKDIELEYHVIRQNHLLWWLRFRDARQNKCTDAIFNKLTDPRQCECGRLLYGSCFFTLNANINGIEELENEHENVHALAKQILNGDNISRNMEELASSSKKFLELLTSIYVEIEKQENKKRLYKAG